MGLETFGFIDDLNPTFPFGNDDVSEGDDHLRGVKLTLKNTFPSNDGPGSFPGMDFFLRDLDIRTISCSGSVDGTSQVAIALTTIDGDGNITGPNHGVSAVTRIQEGEYEIQLFERDWQQVDDLQAAITIDYSLVGGGVPLFIFPDVGSVAQGWVRVVCIPNSQGFPEPADPVKFTIVIFDSGRD